MILKIQGESPFQILSSSFSISPSLQNYVLQISADGVNYSDLFTVSAGQTKMCTGMSNGSYYRLKNNESEVSVNWRYQCNDGGGGSSAYSESAGTAEYASTSDSTKLLEGGAGLPSDANAGDVVAVGSSLSKGLRSAGATLGIYQYDGSDWNKVGEGGGSVDNTILKSVTAFPVSAETGDVVALVKTLYYDLMVPTTAITFEGNDILEITTSEYGSLVVNAYNDGGTNYLKFTSSEEESIEASDGNTVSLPTWDEAKTWSIYYSSAYFFINIVENGPIPVFTENSITLNDCNAQLDTEGSSLGIYQYDGVYRWNQIGLTGPAGPQGPQGQDGATGPQGPQGPAGESASGDSSFIHLDSLSGTGESGKTYEYNQRLYEWVDGAGKWGRWIVTPQNTDTFDGHQFKDLNSWLIYSYLPEVSGEVELVRMYILGNYSLGYVSDNGGELHFYNSDHIQTGETPAFVIKQGDPEVICGTNSSRKIGIQWTEGKIRFRCVDGWSYLRSESLYSTSVLTPHWEAYEVDLFRNVNNNGSGFGYPYWDSDGVVVGKVMNFDSGPRIRFNGNTGYAQFFGRYDSAAPQRMYVPTQSGNSGYVLVSAGNAEPIWVDASTIQGATGAQGPQGQDGAVGPQGPAGQDGATGAQGPQGPAGSGGGGGVSYIPVFDTEDMGNLKIVDAFGVGYVSEDDGQGNPTKYTVFQFDDGSAYIANYTYSGEWDIWEETSDTNLATLSHLESIRDADGFLQGGGVMFDEVSKLVKFDVDYDEDDLAIGEYDSVNGFQKEKSIVTSTNIKRMLKITQSDYDTLVNNDEVDEDTFYIVVADPEEPIGE